MRLKVQIGGCWSKRLKFLSKVPIAVILTAAVIWIVGIMLKGRKVEDGSIDAAAVQAVLRKNPKS